MNEGTSMKDGPGTGEAAGLDAQGAAVIAQEARERARRELWVRRPVLFVTWGLVVLVSYGAMWLSVRGQHPYTGGVGDASAGVLALRGRCGRHSERGGPGGQRRRRPV